ncbi:MAG: hypothetical protein F4Y86_19115 [Gammaproteobacteria bacterium]|nr:hypothetical protein [Gammaproteobacteria bacterium]
MESPDDHTAAPSALGYLYQCRIALLLGIQAIPDTPDASISVERFDDVAFETGGCPTDIIQTKHHLGSSRSLSDKSPDLWRTLEIWCKWQRSSIASPSTTKFVLITTETAQEGSAASFLRVHDRDEDRAHALLLAASSNSASQSNAAAYNEYRTLGEPLRLSLLDSVTVLDRSPAIGDVRADVERELFHVASRDQLPHLVDRLEGWWFDLLINGLSGTTVNAIPVTAIDQQIEQLREAFRRDALPVDYGSGSPTPDVIAELDDRPFVRQLRRIDISTPRIEYAIRDYYRAFEQRGRWLREDLVLDGELDRYDTELVEAWQPRFAAMLENVDAMASADGQKELGRTLFRWAEQDATFPFRGVYERFLTHGSFEILSNRRHVGWHPSYKDD